MTGSHPDRKWIWGAPFVIWLVLLALLGLNAGLSRLPLGDGNGILAPAIGALQAVLIAWFYMRLKWSSGTLVVAALAGAVWVFTMFLLTFGDYTTRPNWWHVAPEQPTYGTELPSFMGR
ncbi:MAG TPA: cytochrome C oxidase subunit IV family protein [Rhizomicrobium sp.]|jgi:caa(3)-type oxidase subunit IV|nr:cytochrome C oxidase subunit IV family protein [Rhizomicrobium sp.]